MKKALGLKHSRKAYRCFGGRKRAQHTVQVLKGEWMERTSFIYLKFNSILKGFTMGENRYKHASLKERGLYAWCVA